MTWLQAFIWLLFACSPAFGMPSVWGHLIRIGMIVSAGSAIGLTVYTYRKSPFVAVTREGILYRLDSATVRTIPWDQVEKAAGAGKYMRATNLIFVNSYKTIDVTPVLNNAAEAERFRKAVDIGKVRYARLRSEGLDNNDESTDVERQPSGQLHDHGTND